MKVKLLKNRSGDLSGLVIPAEDLSRLKNSVKHDTEFYRLLDDLVKEQNIQALKNKTGLPNGLTVSATEKAMKETTEKLYTDAFNKGIPMYYQDGRTSESQFIRANPDGSEDLVEFDMKEDNYKFVKQAEPVGRGQWAYLVPTRD